MNYRLYQKREQKDIGKDDLSKAAWIVFEVCKLKYKKAKNNDLQMPAECKKACLWLYNFGYTAKKEDVEADGSFFIYWGDNVDGTIEILFNKHIPIPVWKRLQGYIQRRLKNEHGHHQGEVSEP